MALHAEGAAVVICGRDAEALGATQAALRDSEGARVDTVEADLRITTSPAAVITRCLAIHDRLDILVNAAGAAPEAGASQYVNLGVWRDTLETHVTAAFALCQQVFPAMEAQAHGRIINLSSVAARIPVPGLAAYTVAKSAVEGLTRALAREWATQGITVNAIVPGVVETQMMRGALAVEKTRDSLIRHVPMRRFASPADVAGLAVFLASEASAYITGATFPVDGGYVLK